MIDNRYKVSQRMWRKWSQQARIVFNEVFRSMTTAPWAFQATGHDAPPKRTWRVTAWNCAWIAADAVDGR